ncbi:cache domain-containing sensor histidine kinase [Clostridium lacusfryxellense]|uniref:cache domain-containing sensor histidine kinase n=1 Tax=Clostridium lacusfryxellense TaxID=205328 RepID=UPI001C0A99A8|nr:sensor histidine kinase [Clostridium lacusfryxellense]MBU3114259.1 sensor histidine kinase [Clostridium lacusfryxellense]
MSKPKVYNKIKFQITSFYFIASLIAIFLMGFILYNSFFNIELSKDLNATKIAVEKSGNYVELYVDKLKVISNILVKNNEAIKYLTGKESVEHASSLNLLLKNTIESDSSIKSIIIVGKDGRLISNEKKLNMSMSSDMMKQQWYVNAINSNNMPVLTKARMQNFSMDKDNWVISISQEIRDKKGNNLGVLLIDVKYKIVDNFLNDLNVGDKDYVFILNDRNEVVYHKDTNYFISPKLQDNLIKESKMDMGYDNKNKMVIQRYKIKNTDWTLFGVSSLNELELMRKNLIETIVVISIMFLCIIAYSGSYFAGRITRPIAKLEEAMRNIEEDFTPVELDEKGCYEVLSLATHFNNMTKRIKILLEEIIQKEKYLRTSELNALHSQINPHFLYNTLDTIAWMAEFKDTQKVVSLTKALAQFFRLSLNGGNEITTVFNEIEHIKQYLYIQQQRYGDKLSCEINCDENISQEKILKIIIQPIVENAIYHGIRQVDRKGIILINVKKEGKDIIFTIRDNGDGFDLSILKSGKSTKDIKLGGVGIKNVDKRIKLYYGEEYGVKIESIIGEGTCVYIRVGEM